MSEKCRLDFHRKGTTLQPMPDHESTGRVPRQSAVRCPRRRAAVGDLLLAALWLAASGCNSIYHRTQTVLPPEPGAQLRLRMDEARRAETLAAQTGTRLRDDLARGMSGERLQADFDRLELAAFELQRRAAAARDVAASSEAHPELAGEIERLHLRSKAWLDYVQAARQAEPAAQVRRLESLLGRPVAPEASRVRYN
jgi:hypothetical protein